MADLGALQADLGITFRGISLLQQSLVHRSYLNENPDLPLESNERLEFLGDAVLGFVVAKWLYFKFPDFSEGELTRLRAALVCGATLARIARSLHLGDYLYLGHGEDDSGGRHRPGNLSCALEAVIGAILLDRGFETVDAFIQSVLGIEFERAVRDKSLADCKSRLQQIIQSEQKVTPVYRTLEETGPDHARVFTVEVVAGDAVLGTGSGRRKRDAEMEAARVALEALTERQEQC